jgi:hypothetical protein
MKYKVMLFRPDRGFDECVGEYVNPFKAREKCTRLNGDLNAKEGKPMTTPFRYFYVSCPIDVPWLGVLSRILDGKPEEENSTPVMVVQTRPNRRMVKAKR